MAKAPDAAIEPASIDAEQPVLKLWQIAVTSVFLVGIWQGMVWLFAPPPFMLPGPKAVVQTLWEQWQFLAENALITLLEMTLGFLLGAGGGIMIALSLCLFPLARRYILPLIIISQTLPVFAIAPLLVLWLGFGLTSKIVMASLIIFFPVASAFYDGLRRTDLDLMALGALYQANAYQILLHIRIPSALPALASGLRIGAVFAPIGAIIGEWVGSSAGLGFVMLHANARAQTDIMFAAVAILAVCALLFRAAIVWATGRMVHWQEEND